MASLIGQTTVLGSHGNHLDMAHAVRAVIVASYLTVVGSLDVALGFIVRSTVGGIATRFGLLLVLPPSPTRSPN